MPNPRRAQRPLAHGGISSSLTRKLPPNVRPEQPSHVRWDAIRRQAPMLGFAAAEEMTRGASPAFGELANDRVAQQQGAVRCSYRALVMGSSNVLAEHFSAQRC